MKKFFLVAVSVILIFGICSCTAQKESKIPTFDESGLYSGFNDLPTDYTPEKAVKDGCYVIVENSLKSGKDAWERFVKTSGKGIDSFLRIVHFIDDMPYYTDLYYYNGKYQTFEQNHELGLTVGTPFSLLRRLDGGIIHEQSRCLYVLTDSTELTHYDVSSSLLSSSIDTITKIPFEWLSFTVYMEVGS
ncbi:MAG: hypothetical protein E7671_05820 [Ruminococcaceae bacterium]|nr:hypothetical protein [Oscillospiraceae bacterium]